MHHTPAEAGRGRPRGTLTSQAVKASWGLRPTRTLPHHRSPPGVGSHTPSGTLLPPSPTRTNPGSPEKPCFLKPHSSDSQPGVAPLALRSTWSGQPSPPQPILGLRAAPGRQPDAADSARPALAELEAQPLATMATLGVGRTSLEA